MCEALPGCLHGTCENVRKNFSDLRYKINVCFVQGTKPHTCACKEGWMGHLCDRPVCSHGCDEKNGFCKKVDSCKKWFFEIILLFYAWFFAAGDLPVPRGVLWAQLHTVPNILALPGIKGK